MRFLAAGPFTCGKLLECSGSCHREREDLDHAAFTVTGADRCAQNAHVDEIARKFVATAKPIADHDAVADLLDGQADCVEVVVKAAQRPRKHQYGGVGQAAAGGHRVRLVAAQAGQQLRDHGAGVVALDEVDSLCQPGTVGGIDLARPDSGRTRRISGQPAAASECRIAFNGLDRCTLACSRRVMGRRPGYGRLGAQPQRVEIAAPYLVASPEQRVQVIGDREMASG